MEYTRIRTLGELKASGYTSRSVKQELRENVMARLRSGTPLFSGILGYDRTVLPRIQHALLAQHDILLLGLRGQAKSRIVRQLPGLLDPFLPIVEGSDLHDDPFRPLSKFARDLVAERGDETPIAWVPREARYGEKLATPDTSMADLIGDIDPIKAAHQRLTYADEEIIHFGLIPRMNRGIFCINELPDLQPRIQVGLFNILEEQDVQIRGFNVRFPLDLLMVFTANPEDYTNRGSIITPLKDRIDAQILTHYPTSLEVSVAITQQEAWQVRDGVQVEIPHYVRELVEDIAFEARKSEFVDQRSGVSARMTRAGLETLVSAAERRALLHEESATMVRISDFHYLETALTGRVELVYEGEQAGLEAVARRLIGQAVKKTFLRYFPDPSDRKKGKPMYAPVLDWFARGGSVDLDPDLSFPAFVKALDAVPGLAALAQKALKPATPEEKAGAMEFILEALHQHSLLGKERVEEGARYGDILGSMLSGMGSDNPEDYA